MKMGERDNEEGKDFCEAGIQAVVARASEVESAFRSAV